MEHGKDGNRMMKDSEEQEQQLISLFHQLIDASMPRLALYLAALEEEKRGSSFSRLHIPKTLLTHTHTHTHFPSRSGCALHRRLLQAERTDQQPGQAEFTFAFQSERLTVFALRGWRTLWNRGASLVDEN